MTRSVGTSFTYQQSGPIVSEPSDKAVLYNAAGFEDATPGALVADTFTIEAWLKRSSATLQGAIFSNVNQGAYMRLSGDRIELLKSQTALIVSSTITITDTTTWHHCVCTKNGATVKQYIDGVDVTGTVTNATCIDPVQAHRVGSEFGDAELFTGNLDEVAVYSTALSVGRVLAHYNAALVVPLIILPLAARISYVGG